MRLTDMQEGQAVGVKRDGEVLRAKVLETGKRSFPGVLGEREIGAVKVLLPGNKNGTWVDRRQIVDQMAAQRANHKPKAVTKATTTAKRTRKSA